MGVGRLAVLRVERGWTQHQLAQTVGVSDATIAAVEKGSYEPSLTLAASLAHLFGGRVEDVFAATPQRSQVVGSPRIKATFVVTDIEGSTRLLAELGSGYVDLLAECHGAIKDAFTTHRGRLFNELGDGLLFAFADALDAVDAALDAQRRLRAIRRPDGRHVYVRMGIHTGEAFVCGELGERYVGLAVHEAARICDLARGGRVLASSETAFDLDGLGFRFVDCGMHELDGLDGPRRVHEVKVGRRWCA